MLKLNMALNKESIDQVIKEISAYKKKIKNSAPEITRLLTEQGVSLAQQNAAYMKIYDTGALVDGIQAEFAGAFGVSTALGKVHSTAPHSAFCEFGTGIVGAGSPHSNPIPGWTYDENNHGEDGWFYYDEGGNKHWTKGMPSRPYMLQTAIMLRGYVYDVAKGVILK
jgi:hypothetical protein